MFAILLLLCNICFISFPQIHRPMLPTSVTSCPWYAASRRCEKISRTRNDTTSPELKHPSTTCWKVSMKRLTYFHLLCHKLGTGQSLVLRMGQSRRGKVYGKESRLSNSPFSWMERYVCPEQSNIALQLGNSERIRWALQTQDRTGLNLAKCCFYS